MDDDGFIIGIIVPILVLGVFLVSTTIATQYYTERISNTGHTFCTSYNLEYKGYEITKTNEIRYECINTTQSKVDGIGIMVRP